MDDMLEEILFPFSRLGEVSNMAISYKKLWKLLIDKDLKKKDLQHLAGISSASITKLGKNENVNTAILQRICKALECDFADIMEMTDNTKTERKYRLKEISDWDRT